MKKYLLSIYQPEGDPPENLDEIIEEMEGLNREMQAAGAWVFAAGLHGPESATVIRVQGDRALVTDGPYIEAKEHFGGFTVIQAADLDEALQWAERLAGILTPLAIEVRPIQE